MAWTEDWVGYELRCGCYDMEGFPNCPYHIADGVVVRNEPPPSGPFDELIRAHTQPLAERIFTRPSLIEHWSKDDRYRRNQGTPAP